MNILLISQCHKNALKETRRIIDQFAERTGDRSWQTHITEKGFHVPRYNCVCKCGQEDILSGNYKNAYTKGGDKNA